MDLKPQGPRGGRSPQSRRLARPRILQAKDRCRWETRLAAVSRNHFPAGVRPPAGCKDGADRPASSCSVRTEYVVGWSDSGVKAFVAAGGVSRHRRGRWLLSIRVVNGSMGGVFSCLAQRLPAPCMAPGFTMHPCRPTPRANSGDADHRSPPFPAQAARRRAEMGRCCPERYASENGGNNRSTWPRRV